jgi:hypothetical protein
MQLHHLMQMEAVTTEMMAEAVTTEMMAEAVTATREFKEQKCLFFISDLYELRELGEQACLKAVGCSGHSLPISFRDTNS